MSVNINGTTGVSLVQDGVIVTADILDANVTDAKIDTMSSSKLTGALPAIDGSALTGTASINIDGTVGATTASTGAFTTLSASSTVSGAGMTARFATPGPIGNTAESTGKFTTLEATGGLNLARSTITQHATTMDLWALANTIDGTGSAVTITAIANAPQAGASRDFVPLAGTTITNNAMFAVQGNADYVSQVGDIFTFTAITVSTYEVWIFKRDGTSLVVADKRAIFGYGYTGANVSMTNLVSNTGVVAADVTGVGTARYRLAAAGYGGDKAIFGYGTTGSSVSMTNLVSNSGVVASDTTGVGTARYWIAAAGYSY